MSALREAAQKALEALEQYIAKELTVGQRYTNEGQGLLDAVATLRAALAEPEQEPIAWLHKHGNYKDASLYPISDMDRIKGWTECPLYTHPAPAKQPGHIVVTKNDSGQIIAVTRQDSDGRVIEVIEDSTDEKK